MDDEQLLHAYARERSESAFGELVTRHIDLVYSSALRVVNDDSDLAQDVAQRVFIDLARKLRIQYPGAMFHVMNRGDQGKDSLSDDQDRQKHGVLTA
jgi:hypothetical protein